MRETGPKTGGGGKNSPGWKYLEMSGGMQSSKRTGQAKRGQLSFPRLASGMNKSANCETQ